LSLLLAAKAELTYRQACKSYEAVEMATLQWMHGYNHQRLRNSILPAKAEANVHQQQAGSGHGGLT